MKINRSYRKSTVPPQAKCVFEGVLFDVYQWEQELYDGTKTTFERLCSPDIIKVIPVLVDGTILITEDEQPAREKLVKFPGGYVDPGESAEDTAHRELLEETGYKAGELKMLVDRAPWNKVDYHRIYFVALQCKKVQEPAVQAGERMTTQYVTFDEAVDLLANGTISDIEMQIMALQAKLDPAKMAELRTLFAQ